ncbi:hypothetical protein [Microvirga rosea]|uniref:hypothetical protein n=1 Tax=Microvirga rosea TaxID=2715425 RepID=UPI001D0BC9B0|nr:hypothetical protein [Microvirga rosea]MCB8820308.1 hypothetical protein [Microvirga rosea]
MLVIGLSRLESYWTQHPQAEVTLRALHALLAAAEWVQADDLLRQWSGIARHEGESFRIALDPEGCEVWLQVNFPLGIAQIQAVHTKSLQGAPADERERETHSNPGGLRASPA